MDEMVFQNIFEKVQVFLPQGWRKVLLYVGYANGSYSMKYYTECGDGKIIDCFKQEGVNRAQLIKLFIDIDRVVAKEREMLEEGKKWSVLTMIVDNEGNMKMDLDYTDISENAIAYENNWKQKYLS